MKRALLMIFLFTTPLISFAQEEGSYSYNPIPKTYTYNNYQILINTSPPGMKIYFNNKFKGKSPVKITINEELKEQTEIISVPSKFYLKCQSQSFLFWQPIPHEINFVMQKLCLNDFKIPLFALANVILAVIVLMLTKKRV